MFHRLCLLDLDKVICGGAYGVELWIWCAHLVEVLVGAGEKRNQRVR